MNNDRNFEEDEEMISTDFTLRHSTINKPSIDIIDLTQDKRTPKSLEYGQKVVMRSIRSLLAGSLHQVWEDYRFIARKDVWCTNVHLAASRMANRSKIKFQVPEGSL